MTLHNLVKIILLAIIVAFFACEKEDVYLDPNARLHFSVDTLSFDTVFTTVGSVTLNFRVYNPYNKDLNISHVVLKGASTPFRINVDGEPGGIENKVENVLIGAKDSMHVFVEATLDANNDVLPLVIMDSIEFITNGNAQFVKLLAYGQDVHHISIENADFITYLGENKTHPAVVLNTTQLLADKPYLIHNHIVIDTLETLTLKEGVVLYMRKDVSMFVKGSLKIEGTFENPVEIRGDRLDDVFDGLPYDKIPGQWGYIHLLPGSMNNTIDYALIRNAVIGIQVDSVVTLDEPTLRISNTRIQNMTYAGIYAQGAEIEASNCVIANCGERSVVLSIGGAYNFTHCTIGNYYTWSNKARQTPSVVLNNFYKSLDGKVIARDLKAANFYNSIIYGTLLTEVALLNEYEKEPVDAEFNYLFDYCIIRGKSELDTSDTDHFKNILWDKDPMFLNPSENFDFRLDSLSPAINFANPAYAEDLPIDLLNNNRLKDGKPDLGAMEYVSKSEED